MKKVKGFFKGIKKEAAMVRWPSGKDMLKYSFVVLFMMLFFGVYFYGLDLIFSFLKGLMK